MCHGMWDLSSPDRDQPLLSFPPTLEARSPNHWNTREVPLLVSLNLKAIEVSSGERSFHAKFYFGTCFFFFFLMCAGKISPA